jgi:outer membrane protein
MYPKLALLKDNIPLVNPNPQNIDDWSSTAEQQNISLLAQRYLAQAARQGIKVAFAGHFPTVSLTGSYGAVNSTDLNNGNATNNATTAAYGITANLPLFSGGGVNAATETAEYAYQVAHQQVEISRRALVAQTRQLYLNIVAGISQIQADREAVVSAAAALASYEAGYKVGTQTIVDVLTAQSNLYSAELQYTSDRYNYVNNILALKQAAGTLTEQDVININAWLTNDATLAQIQAKNNSPSVNKKIKA